MQVSRIVGIVLLCSVLIVTIIMILPLRGTGHLPAKSTVTRTRLRNLTACFRRYRLVYECFPLGTTSNIISVFNASNTDTQNPRRLSFLHLDPKRKGYSPDVDSLGNYLDGWKRPIYILFNPDRTQVTLRSLGKNGVEDQDDIVEIIAIK